MSTYVMSDLHGCLEEFEKMLETIAFSEEDRLYIIGDVVDRGPSSIALLQRIMGMNNVDLLNGNHEKMMLYAIVSGSYAHWYQNGGDITMEQLLLLTYTKQAEIVKYLSAAPVQLQLEVGGRKFYLVHAYPSTEEDIHTMLWERPNPDKVFFEDMTVIVGHTPTGFFTGGKLYDIYHGANTLFIDCGCFFTGVLGCLRLDDMEEFYVRPSVDTAESRKN